eukprot:TRINITY_DN1880_c0_g1_i1.p1 TRINITY_DN1880_c0_g1~~TRINITY_DN1880_c0_g1_i1.p1  ORF type:complete len:413 (-),score=82.42 TRINITY_DN1880_c0_g1_i1:66-1304(-)
MPKRPDLREFVLVKNTMSQVESEQKTNGDINSPPTPPKKAKEREKNCVDEEYFNSYNDINIHKLMLQDGPRTRAYEKAILENSELFTGKTVLDVGAGSGILSLFCMKAGAKKVYAVEASPFVHVLREVIELNDENGIIEVIHGKAEEIELPSQVDIIVSEWMGFYLLHESMLDSVIKARDKHLQDDGVMFPSHSTVYCAAVQLDEYMEDNVGYWESVYGFNMLPVATRVLENKLSGGAPEVLVLKESQLLSEPCVFTEYDLRWVQLDEVKSIRDRKFASITRDGKFHGVALWFSCDFKPVFYDEEMAEKVRPVTLDTGPNAEPTHWKQTVIVVPRNDSEVEKDEIVGWEISMDQSEDNPRHYQLGLSLLDPETDEHPVPCECKMARCALFAALMQKEEDDLEEIPNIEDEPS